MKLFLLSFIVMFVISGCTLGKQVAQKGCDVVNMVCQAIPDSIEQVDEATKNMTMPEAPQNTEPAPE